MVIGAIINGYPRCVLSSVYTAVCIHLAYRPSVLMISPPQTPATLALRPRRRLSASVIVSLLLSTGVTMRSIAAVEPASMTTLSAAKAAELASQAEGVIGLDSVVQLAPDAALQLARHANGLSLDGLQTVDAATARALAMHGRLDHIDQDDELDVDTILQKIDACFATSTGEALNGEDLDAVLADLAGSPDDAAEGGADEAASDPWLSLGGLRTISPEAASALAMHDGPLLLDGLATISTDVARSLATHSGELSLAGLTRLSDDARAALEEHDGPVTLPDALVSTADSP